MEYNPRSVLDWQQRRPALNISNIFGLAVVFIIALYLIRSIKILSEYERGVIFRLGRVLSNPKGPGIILATDRFRGASAGHHHAR